jgi:hypothetical protein
MQNAAQEGCMFTSTAEVRSDRADPDARRFGLALAALILSGGLAPEGRAANAEALHVWWQTCVSSSDQLPTLLRCAVEHEQQQLAVPGEPARRLGQELILHPATEQPLRFINRSADGGPARQHFYLGGLDGTDAHLVLTLEDGRPPRVELVPVGVQVSLQLDALPWPAPGGRLLAVVSGAEGQPGGSISLLQRSGTRWSQQFRYEPPASVIFSFKSWRADGASLRLDWQRGKLAGKSCTPLSGSLQLRDGPYGWDFVPAPPVACAP